MEQPVFNTVQIYNDEWTHRDSLSQIKLIILLIIYKLLIN